jgi:hypothetical protein
MKLDFLISGNIIRDFNGSVDAIQGQAFDVVVSEGFAPDLEWSLTNDKCLDVTENGQELSVKAVNVGKSVVRLINSKSNATAYRFEINVIPPPIALNGQAEVVNA